MTLLEGGEVARFVVGDPVDPTAKENTNPLEGKCTNGGVVRSALCPVALVEGPCPERVWNGAGDPLDESLAEEFGASPTPVDPVGLATALGDWRNAREPLQCSGGSEAVALLTEGNEESRREDLSCAGKVGKQFEVGKRLAATCDLFVEADDACRESSKLWQQGFDEEQGRLDNCRVGGQ